MLSEKTIVSKKLVVGWIKPQFFGYTATACKVVLDIELREKSESQESIWLKQTDRQIVLMISGIIKHGREVIEAGQISDTLRKALSQNKFQKLKISKDLLKKLLDVWDKWHRNDLRPYCIHQKSRKFIEISEVCQECGYVYGSKWLYEPMPDDVIQFIKAL